MKIVCGSCGAKYSISDDKVQGKVFKIRCRKCSNVIVVKGTADEEGAGASEASAGAYDGFGGGSSAAEWYVVIDGEQAGPLTPEELEAYHASGRVTLESFVWRDGMDDWKTLRDVDVFAHLAAYDTGGGYGAEEATQIAQIPVSNDSPTPASDYGAGDFEEDATAVVNTADIPGVMNSEPAADPYDGYGDPTEAGQSYNEAELAAAAAGGYGGGYESNGYDQGYGQNGYDQGAGGYDQGDYGGGYEQNGYGDFGQDAGMAAAGVDLGGGYGQVGAGAGMSQYDEGGDQSDGMFSAFESQPSGGGDQGLAYQSFSGLDSGGGGIDLSGVDSNGAAGASPANDMIGSRNENSVLFSLSSLQQVEAVSADSAPAGGAAGGGGGVTEGSGLIDIQALASSHAAMKSAGADDVLGGPTPETFSPGTMSVPAIMPRGSHRSNNGLMIAIAVIGLIAIVGIGGIGYYVFTKEDKPIEQKVIVKETVKVVEKEVPGNNGAAEAAAKAAMADASKADEGTDGEEVAAKSDSKSGSKASSKKKSSSGSAAKKDTGSSSASVIPKKSTSSKPKKTVKGKSGIDSILDGLDKEDKKSSSSSKKKDTGSTASAKKRSKADISNTFKKYQGRFNACPNSGGLKPPIRIRLKIAPSGKVTSAKVDAKSSQFKGTDIGACAQKVARSMKFPAASNDSSFAYPVKF